MLAIQLNLFMVILLSIILGYAYFKFDKKDRSLRLFLALIAATTLILVLEMISVALNAEGRTSYIEGHWLVDTLGFVLAPLIPILAALYVYKRTNEYIKIAANKLLGLSIPWIANGILSLGSYHYHWLFHINSANLYERGPLFVVSPLTSFFYYLVTLLLLYENRKKLNKEELIVLSLLSVIPVMLSVFQLHYFIYLTIWNGMAIAIVINYIFILQNQTTLDPLTGLGNRLAYNEYLANLSKKSDIILSVVTIDLDDFKKINDIYGHHEGDNVLLAFARELKTVFEGRGVPIRVGGDEFIVFIDENQPEVVEKYIETLIEKINMYNDSLAMPYRINFSYGLTIYDNCYGNLQEMMQHSDKRMYEDKQQKEAKNLNAERSLPLG